MEEDKNEDTISLANISLLSLKEIESASSSNSSYSSDEENTHKKMIQRASAIRRKSKIEQESSTYDQPVSIFDDIDASFAFGKGSRTNIFNQNPSVIDLAPTPILLKKNLRSEKSNEEENDLVHFVLTGSAKTLLPLQDKEIKTILSTEKKNEIAAGPSQIYSKTKIDFTHRGIMSIAEIEEIKSKELLMSRNRSSFEMTHNKNRELELKEEDKMDPSKFKDIMIFELLPLNAMNGNEQLIFGSSSNSSISSYSDTEGKENNIPLSEQDKKNKSYQYFVSRSKKHNVEKRR